MELWQVVGNLSPGVAVGVLCLYYYNQMALRYLEDRKQWNEYSLYLIERYDVRLEKATEANSRSLTEMHALRGRVQEFMSMIELRLQAMDDRIRAISDQHRRRDDTDSRS